MRRYKRGTFQLWMEEALGGVSVYFEVSFFRLGCDGLGK